MTSAQGYSAACIELYSRLWAELEQLSAPEHCGATHSVTVERWQILRLEIHLLIDACDTARWRMLMSKSERRCLKASLRNLLDGLGPFGSAESAHAIAAAQNRLLNAVLEHCAPHWRVPKRAGTAAY